MVTITEKLDSDMQSGLKVLLIKSIKFNLVHSRLGDRFLLKLNDLCDLTIYGSNPKELKDRMSDEEFKKLKLVEHHNDYIMEDILDLCGMPDVILLHQHINASAMIPSDFAESRIPKALMLFDTYINEDNNANLKKAKFTEEQNIDLVIRRGCRSFYDEDLWLVPSVWLPFSVREENYYTDPATRYLYGRRNKVTFVGGGYESRNKLYVSLKKAVNTLKEARFEEDDVPLDQFTSIFTYQGIVGVGAYPNALKTCVAALSYSFEQYKGHPAKLFELMGSGTAVLTTSFSNKKELFGEEDCFWEFSNNCHDLVNVAKRVLDPNERKDLYRVTNNALRVINSRHLDKHRIVELLEILEALASGSQIPQFWE
jgi:hypothetical protein